MDASETSTRRAPLRSKTEPTPRSERSRSRGAFTAEDTLRELLAQEARNQMSRSIPRQPFVSPKKRAELHRYWGPMPDTLVAKATPAPGAQEEEKGEDTDFDIHKKLAPVRSEKQAVLSARSSPTSRHSGSTHVRWPSVRSDSRLVFVTEPTEDDTEHAEMGFRKRVTDEEIRHAINTPSARHRLDEPAVLDGQPDSAVFSTSPPPTPTLSDAPSLPSSPIQSQASSPSSASRPQFNIKAASEIWNCRDGYVSFLDVEGLGHPANWDEGEESSHEVKSASARWKWASKMAKGLFRSKHAPSTPAAQTPRF